MSYPAPDRVENVVLTGTALSVDQIKLISRYLKTFIFCLTEMLLVLKPLFEALI